MATEKKINYSIIAHVADIGEDEKAWNKEINIMTWGKSKRPVIDIRKWNRTEEEPVPGKGISLSLSDFNEILNINIKEYEDLFNIEEEK